MSIGALTPLIDAELLRATERLGVDRPLVKFVRDVSPLGCYYSIQTERVIVTQIARDLPTWQFVSQLRDAICTFARWRKYFEEREREKGLAGGVHSLRPVQPKYRDAVWFSYRSKLEKP